MGGDFDSVARRRCHWDVRQDAGRRGCHPPFMCQKEETMSTTTDPQGTRAAVSPTSTSRELQYWVTSRRGAVEIAAFSNPPHNYLTKSVIDELERFESENSKNYPAYAGH